MSVSKRRTRFAYLLLAATGCTSSNMDVISLDSAADAGTGGVGSAACPAAVLSVGDTSETVQVGSTSRSYVLHVPSTYDGTKAVPLLVDFHALTGTGARERAGSTYPPLTDPEGVIMAFPDGLPGPSGAAWNFGPCCVANVDDVAFIRAMVTQIKSKACIDAGRVYATGVSIGGGMSHYLACHASDVFAAVAPAAFDLVEENAGACKPTNPVTVVSFRGTADPLEPYDGGYSSVVSGMPITFLGARATFQKWAELNQCTDAASSEDANGCSAHSACQGGVEVILCTKQGGGLEAPNAAVAWPVLKRHRL